MADNTVEFNIVVQGKNVSVVQKQTDKLAKSTDRAGDSTERLTKKQDKHMRREKGVGQMGMNTTKSFSKMQQTMDGGGGGGGLVRAYALLAANVFALTAAFGVLSRSAQIDTLTQSMEILSTTGGTYIKNLAKEMQAASGYAIDLAQAFSQVSLASSAGLSTSEIEGLTKVAKGAAISLGRNLPDAMDRIFRGAIKLEPEILDEIGLFVRVDEAAQKYARDNGKVVSSLSQVEKRQAFLNEILEQGEKKFSEYADTIKPDPYVRLGAALGDIAQEGLSLLNGVLGPILGFLAESKVALTAVFGALVGVLLKKAIPAMGLMTKGAADLAKERADAAKAYSKSITETAEKELATASKSQKDQRKKANDRLKEGKRFQSRSKLDGADVSKLDKAKLGSLKRQTAIEDRILVLKKAQRKVDNKNQRMIKEELAILKEEQRIEERLAKLKAKSGIAPGSLAERRQEKLDSKSRVQTVVAGAAGTMETQGLSAGWRELNDELREGEKLADGGRRAFTGKEKAMARFKGAVSGAGVAMNKAMMIMGPWMAAFAMLAPFLMAFGKWLGLASVEAGKFDESLKKLADASKDLHKRFKTQTDQLLSGKLTFLESTNAALAFNKGMLEASRGTQEMNKRLDEFKREATNSAKAWEAFKGLFGLDRESKALDQQLETVKKQIEGLARESGVEGAADFFAIKGAEDFANQVVVLQEAEQAFTGIRDARREAGAPIGSTESQLLEEYRDGVIGLNESWRRGGVGMFNARRAVTTLEDKLKALHKEQNIGEKESQALIDSAKEEAAQYGLLQLVIKKVVGTRQQMDDAQEVNADKTEKEVNRLAILKSNMEGASESIGKFAQSFQLKTKADDLNSSLSAMNDSIVGTEKVAKMTKEELSDFFTKMEEESDNAFSKIFSKEEIEAFKKGNITAWTAMVNQVKEYQHNVHTTKNKQAELKREIKELTAFNAAGFEVNKKRFTKEAEIKRKTADLTSDEHDLVLATNKLSEGTLTAGIAILEGKGTMIEKEEKLRKLTEEGDITREKIMAGQQSLLAKQTTEREAQVAEATKLERAEKATAEASLNTLKATKALVDAQRERVRLQLELQAKMTGGAVTPIDAARQTLATAKETFTFEVEAAKLKQDVLKAEHEILKIRMKLFFLEAGMATQDPKTKKITLNPEAQGYLDTLSKGFNAKSSTINVALENAAYRFGIATTEAIGNSFKAGSGSGILGAIRGAAAAVGATGADGMIDTGLKDDEGNAIKIQGLTAEAAAVQVLKSSYQELIATMADLGPAGAVVAGFAQGSLTVMTAMENQMASHTAIENALDAEGKKLSETDQAWAKTAANVEMAGQIMSGIGQMLAANSKGQIMEIDNQINAEKKRDGKSKESLAKIAALEKKKEAMQRKAFEQQKKVQMAVTIANTASSIMAAVSAPPIGLGWPAGLPLAVMAAAMGAVQLAVISKTKYQGGSSEAPKAQMAALNIGKRSEKVDVSRGASGGELGYLRGQRGMGGPQNFVPTGGAAGLRRGYAEGGVLVGERGPEVIAPRSGYEVTPNDELGGGTRNVNFTINAVDAAGVEEVLMQQRGNIIGMIREAANDTGERFLESVDTDVVGVG